MKNLLSHDDWQEIYYALETKAREIQRGKYDDFPGEVTRPRSESRRWAVHLRRIMSKIDIVQKPARKL